MTLDLDRLMRFDLDLETEQKLLGQPQSKEAKEFFATAFQIMSTDEFIKDSPSYP